MVRSTAMSTLPDPSENYVIRRLSPNPDLYKAYQNNPLVHMYFKTGNITGEGYDSILEKLVLALVDQNKKYFDMAVHAEATRMPDPLFMKGQL
jgi:hypothetical protein